MIAIASSLIRPPPQLHGSLNTFITYVHIYLDIYDALHADDSNGNDIIITLVTSAGIARLPTSNILTDRVLHNLQPIFHSYMIQTAEGCGSLCHCAPLVAGPFSRYWPFREIRHRLFFLSTFSRAGLGTTLTVGLSYPDPVQHCPCRLQADKMYFVDVPSMYMYSAFTVMGGWTLARMTRLFESPSGRICIEPTRSWVLSVGARKKTPEMQSRCQSFMERVHCSEITSSCVCMYPNDACNRHERLTWHTH